jgi:hypothetical protein
MIVLSLSKEATKSKELAVPKGSCENKMSGELAANPFALAESNISMFCDAKLRKLRKSKKKLGQPTACSLWLSTAYDGLRPLCFKREVAR